MRGAAAQINQRGLAFDASRLLLLLPHQANHSPIPKRQISQSRLPRQLFTMADAMNAVSAGALRKVFTGEHVVDPVVQCVQIKSMQSGNGQERYRVVFNDSVNFIQSMIAQRRSSSDCLDCGQQLTFTRDQLGRHGRQVEEGSNMPTQGVPGKLCQREAVRTSLFCR